MPFLKLKTGHFFCFLFFENIILPAERRGFLKNKQKTTTKKTQFLKLKTGPIMLRNILGPVFNFNLDQFLTLEFCYFLVFWGGAETPIFYSVVSKKCKIERNTKKTLFVNTPVLTVLVKMSVFFCIFDFCCFLEFPCFSEMFLIGFQKFKNKKNESNKNKTRQQQENKMQSKNKSKIMIQKTTRQQAEKNQKNNLK